jgi:hypothetical protein
MNPHTVIQISELSSREKELHEVNSLKIAIPSAVLVAGFLTCTSISFGTPEFAKKEKKGCGYCHAKTVPDKAEMAKNLNDTGTCYKDNGHSLAKCSAPKR